MKRVVILRALLYGEHCYMERVDNREGNRD